jgi:simple sugar transport system substrate-binding protein
MKFARHPLLATLLFAAIVVTACGKKDAGVAPPVAASPAPAPVVARNSTGVAAESARVVAGAAVAVAATTAAAGEAVAAGKSAAAGGGSASAPLAVAFVHASPVGDGGWSFTHDRGRKDMETAFEGKVKTTTVEAAPDGGDVETVLRELATSGNRIVFGTAPGFREAMLRVAPEFPDVKWEHAGGYKSGANLRSYDLRADQSAYLAGIIAGKMTHTDTLGFIASVPLPEVIRNINAFTLGAQSVNPAVRTKVVWVNKWFDPGRESEAAQALINGGADVLLQNTGSAAPLQVAEKAGKHAFGWNSSMKAHGTKAHLGSATVDWAPYYTKAVSQVLEGTWKAETHSWGIKEGVVDLVDIAEVVPEDVKALVEEKKKAIADGSFRIWKGPMISSDDREVLSTGAIGDRAFISSIMFYVKGVEGKVPAAN